MTRKAENRPWQGLGGLTILVISILRWVISRQYSSIENLAVRQSWLHGIPYSMLAVFEKQCFFHSGGCCASGHLVVKYSTKKLRLPAWRVTDRTCSSYIGARPLCTDRALAILLVYFFRPPMYHIACRAHSPFLRVEVLPNNDSSVLLAVQGRRSAEGLAAQPPSV